MIHKLYALRFDLFFVTQIAILFGSIVVPSAIFEFYLAPILFQLNIISGILLLSKKRKLVIITTMLCVLAAVIAVMGHRDIATPAYTDFVQLSAYFAFYVIITYELVRQVWTSAQVNKNIILGLMSGYISLGLIGFFTCLSIEMLYSGSFTNLIVEGQTITERVMYYSYVTLLTIGYGDITPANAIAQKASILIGLAGQFYLVILTAVVVGKYINQKLQG